MMRVIIKDSGMDGLIRSARNLKGGADVGVFGKTHSEQVIIAATNEFGTSRAGRGNRVKIPERSFLRSTLDEQKETIRKTVDQVRVDIVTGKESKGRFLERLGLWFVGKVQEKIRTGPFVPNAAYTKIRKLMKGRKDSKPLIDEGRLIQSITHRVKDGLQ